MPSRIGDNKRYILKHRLGEGGMGSVYLAYDNERETHVALKWVTRNTATNIYRLKQEFRSLAEISHPNLVTLHELISDGEDWFITMELIEGQGYYDFVFGSDDDSDVSRITISDSMPSIQTCRANIPRLRLVLSQLCRAIHALHEAGKLHRDIKPSNVMVTSDLRVVLLDFGLVRERQNIDIDRTIDNDLLGTPAYMSPEQASGHPLTAASDWYSLGSMLYETLTGHLPFEGSVIDIMQEKVLHDPIPPSLLVKDIPSDLNDLCFRLLSRIPEDRPCSEEILESLTGSSTSPPALRAQSAPPPRSSERLFVGRREELAELHEAFQAVVAGKSATVFIHGSSGIGKTALIRIFISELIEDDKAVILKGRCFERESVPYKALDNVVDALTKYLSHLPPGEVSALLPRDMHSLAVLFPVLQRVNAVAESKSRAASNVDPRVLRNRAFSALKELFQRLSDIRPLVLSIDDLHWGDLDSARLLLEIFGPPDPPPILFIGSYRSEEADSSPFLREILDLNAYGASLTNTRYIALDRLPEFEAQQMAQKILGELSLFPSERARTIAEEADGIPFFIAELARYAKAHKQGDGSIPPTRLDQVVNHRVANLPQEARKLLEIFAVAARPIEQAVALRAAGLPTGDRTPLVKLRNARLIRSRGVRSVDTAEAYHARISLAVRSGLSNERLRECHAALAEALVASGIDDSERLITFYRGAGKLYEAGKEAAKAADEASSKLAFNRAVELYQIAIDLLPDDRGRALYHKLGDALANSGRGAKASEVYLEIRERVSAAEARELGRKAAKQLFRSGRVDRAIRLSRELLEELGLQYPSGTVSALGLLALNRLNRRALSKRIFRFAARQEKDIDPDLLERLDTLGAISMELATTDVLPGVVLQSKFLELALEAGEPLRILRGLSFEVDSAAIQGGIANERWAERLLRIMSKLTATIGTPYAKATTQLSTAITDLFCGWYSNGVRHAEEAVRLFADECVGASWEQNYATSILYGLLEFNGGIRRIAREAPQKAREAGERDDRFLHGFLALSLPLAYLMNGDVEMAEAMLEERRRQLSGPFNNYHLWVMMRSIDTFLYRGQGYSALEYLEKVWPDFQRTFIARTGFFKMTTRFHHARCAIAAAEETRDDRYLDLVHKDIKVISRLKRRDADCFVNMLRASVAWYSGEAAKARHLLRRSIEMCKQAQMGMLATYCQRNLGQITDRDEERKLVMLADEALEKEGVREPDRWTAVRLPGFRFDRQPLVYRSYLKVG